MRNSVGKSATHQGCTASRHVAEIADADDVMGGDDGKGSAAPRRGDAMNQLIQKI